MRSIFLLFLLRNGASVLSQDGNAYAVVPLAHYFTVNTIATVAPDSFCARECARKLQEDINVVGENSGFNDVRRLKDMFTSPISFTSNQTDVLVQMCKHGFKEFKPCLAGCPESKEIDIMLISLRPIDYICKDHLKEFVDALPCISNVSIFSMENECKLVADNIMNLINRTRMDTTTPSMSPDDTVTFMDRACWYAYEYLKCIQPRLLEKCGSKVEKLIFDVFNVAIDAIIKITTYLTTNVANKSNVTIKSSAARCQMVLDDMQLSRSQINKPASARDTKRYTVTASSMESSTTIISADSCAFRCSKRFENAMVAVNRKTNNLQASIKSPLIFASDQPELMVKMCRYGYKGYMPCLTNCPRNEAIDMMLISLKPLDYFCNDHLKEFIDTLPCIANVTNELMPHRCKSISEKMINLSNETTQVNATSLDGTITFMDKSCSYSLDLFKCMQADLAKMCGSKNEKLFLGALHSAVNATIDMIAHLKTKIAKTINTKVAASAVQCQKAKKDAEIMIKIFPKAMHFI